MKKTLQILIFSLAIATSLFSFEVLGVKKAEAGVGSAAASVLFPVLTSTLQAASGLSTAVNAVMGKQDSGADDCQVGWLGQVVPWTGFLNMSFNCIVAQISNMMLRLTSMLLWMAGLIFQQTLLYSLNLTKFINGLDIVDVGWKIFRDIANICFIFILLAIAIGTILRIDSYHVKKTLASVIIAALLLNFSLFFTKVVIDASNILALQFYSQIVVSGDNNAWDGGLSSAMMKTLGVSSIYSDPNSVKKDTSSFTNIVVTKTTTLSNIIGIGTYGSVFILCTAFVFLAGTIMFLIRTLVLIFLMILSPLAFMCLSLPSLKGNFAKWQKRLISEAIFAPAFMIMIYIVFKALDQKHTSGDGDLMNFASFLTGNKDSTGTAVTFIVLIGLMLGSLIVAKQFGATGGDFARKFAGKASFGAAGWMGRQTIGRGAKAIQESAAMKSLVKSGGVGGILGRNLEKGLKRTSESSMDLRNTAIGKAAGGAVGGLGDVGGKGGYAKSFKDSQKDLEDQQKRVKELSPVEQSEKEEAEDGKKVAETRQKIADMEYKAANESTETSEESYRRLETAKLKKDAADALVATYKNQIDKVTQKAKDRGEAFATADIVSEFASKIGITTAQMGMVRKVRKEKNKSEEDKLIDALTKKMKEKNPEEGKKEAEEKPPKA